MGADVRRAGLVAGADVKDEAIEKKSPTPGKRSYMALKLNE